MNEDTHEKYTNPLFDADEHGFEPDKPEADNTDVDRAEQADLDVEMHSEGDAGLDIDLSGNEANDETDGAENNQEGVDREAA